MLTVAVVALYIAAIAGFALALRSHARSRIGHVFAGAVALYLLVLSAGAEVGYAGLNGARYRSPTMPILSLFAAVGVASLWQTVKSSRNKTVDQLQS